ncbi:MAG: hypothetical protein ACTHWM_02280 [Yaniella sp.]|uniref:hypothetical protein n=1 Tax=Yaniella sp. TaxID=2773929 RepID=UPI003F9BC36C
MTHPESEEHFEKDRRTHGYFERDVDDFHREANVLAGHDPHDVSADPPQNLRLRRLFVFATLTVIGLLAAGLALGLMALPECENPQYNWMPCIPNF